MQEKYRAQGLILIASHVQNVDKATVVGLCRSQKVNYTVTSHGRPQGDESRGIPQAYLFDWTGKLVAEGRPDSLYGKLDELMAQAPSPLTGGRTFTDGDVRKVADKLRAGRGYGKALEELDELAEELEGDGKAEASDLAERIRKDASRRLERARVDETEDPGAAWERYHEVEALYKGAEAGDQAEARLKELKKDKAFQTELKAAKLLAQVEALADQLVATNGTVKPDHPSNRRPLAGIAKLVSTLEKKYPESKAAERAREIAKSYGL